MADLGLLSGVAEGLKQGLGSYMQVKQANDQSRQAAEDAALKKRMFDQQITQKSDEFEYQKHLDKIKRKFAKKHGTYIEIDLRKIKTTEQAIEYVESILKTLL